jgi:hypothetical protein
MIGPIILCVVVLAVAVAIWQLGIEWIPDGHCKLHDWQPERDGRLRCAKCHRRPSDE